jgi:hypothetical protein
MIPTAPVFHQNAVLFGHDASPRLLAFERDGESHIRVYARHADGKTTAERQDFRPFLLLAAATTSTRSTATACTASWFSSTAGATH